MRYNVREFSLNNFPTKLWPAHHLRGVLLQLLFTENHRYSLSAEGPLVHVRRVNYESTTLSRGATSYSYITGDHMQSAKAIGMVLLAGLGLSASASAAEGDLPGLPWQMAGNNHVLIGVVWNEAVLKVVPKGLSATPERTGGINIYHSPRGYGAAPYQSGYGWIDLAGNDAADGSKARYIFRAGVGPTENITQAFTKIWGSGIRSGGTKLESADGVLQATGMMSGKVWGTVKIKTSDQCGNAAGTLNYFIPSPDGSKLSRMQIPFSTIACGAEPVTAEINFPDPDIAGVKPEKLLWAAELREAAFGFTQPVAWK